MRILKGVWEGREAEQEFRCVLCLWPTPVGLLGKNRRQHQNQTVKGDSLKKNWRKYRGFIGITSISQKRRRKKMWNRTKTGCFSCMWPTWIRFPIPHLVPWECSLSTAKQTSFLPNPQPPQKEEGWERVEKETIAEKFPTLGERLERSQRPQRVKQNKFKWEREWKRDELEQPERTQSSSI